jgi:hypothetical protein
MGPRDALQALAGATARVEASTDLAELRAIALDALEALGAVATNDRTPDYGYGKGPAHRNRLGDSPAPGTRWNTPAEIVGETLRDLGRRQVDRLEAAPIPAVASTPPGERRPATLTESGYVRIPPKVLAALGLYGGLPVDLVIHPDRIEIRPRPA